MKYLKIEGSKGLYWDGSSYKEIDKIDKKDLLMLINSADSEDFEIDSYDESLSINKAHQIIYENIFNKLNQFLDDKEQFKKESDELYKNAINKYSVEIKEDYVVEGLENEEEDEDNNEIKIGDVPF